jgi:CheY-like chemotaxis protein
MIRDSRIQEQMEAAKRVRSLCRAQSGAGLYNYDRLAALLKQIQGEGDGRLGLEGDYVSSRKVRERESSGRVDVPQEGQSGAFPAARSAGGHVLLVDDEPEIREMACSALEMRGYSVAICRNGQEAIEYYREQCDRVDLVVSDVVMPEMNGRELLDALKQINPQVKVVLMSGYCTDATAAGLIKQGALEFISKPFSLDELWQAADSALACEGHAA